MDCNSCRNSGDPIANAIATLKCAKVSQRNIDQSDVISYAHRSGASGSDQLCSAMISLLAGRIVYWKTNPGDCPLKSDLKLGPASQIVKVGGIGLTGVGAASSISLFATGGAGIGGSAAGAGAALGGLPAIAGAAASVVGLALIPLAVWAAFSAHHKLAVAREQATICDFMQAFNGWCDAMEQGLISGQTSLSDLKSAVPIVEQQMMAGLSSILKQCNAACYMQKNLRAIDLYNIEKGYDILATKVSSSTSSLPGASKTSQGGALTIATAVGLGTAALV